MERCFVTLAAARVSFALAGLLPARSNDRLLQAPPLDQPQMLHLLTAGLGQQETLRIFRRCEIDRPPLTESYPRALRRKSR
jgi:hypothetical protein